MPTLAPKLPWTHPFAGGYPRVGGQPLPTDPDAIDYLNRVAAADGAAVEVGVAMAVDQFIKGCKADGIWDAIKASCIMCGARTISGALVPLKGVAPTAQGGWTASDYLRGGTTPGLKGNGSTLYLDTNRANNADGQDDVHLSAYITAAATVPSAMMSTNSVGTAGASTLLNDDSGRLLHRLHSNADTRITGQGITTGFKGATRNSPSSYTVRSGGSDTASATSSQTPTSANMAVFSVSAASPSSYTDARISFYSIGSACDLAALDARVSALMAAIQAFLS